MDAKQELLQARGFSDFCFEEGLHGATVLEAAACAGTVC
jgi:hypothetical protein